MRLRFLLMARIVDMTLLGIDPGLRITGFAVLSRAGSKIMIMEHGIIRLPASRSLGERLSIFYDFFVEKIPTWHLSGIVFERPFLGDNVQSYVKLGYTHGLVHMLAARHNLMLQEFAPSEVKKAVTGSGSASKEQVARLLLRLFPLLSVPDKLDLTDAIAVALCGLWQRPIVR
jgi:crossover junction endodeoxyribonuclease RuvC